MNNQQIINNIIENAKEQGVPERILEAFKVEATESGYDLSSEQGADWYSNRSVLAEYWGARLEEESTVTFSWDFEDCGESGVIKHISVSDTIAKPEGYESWTEYTQDAGLAAARSLCRKMAKRASMKWIETTDAGMAQSYRVANLMNYNEYQR